MTLKELKTYIDETLKVLPNAEDSEIVIPIEGGYYNAHIALDGILFLFQPKIKRIFLHTTDDISKNDIEGYAPSSPMQLVELNGSTVIVRDHKSSNGKLSDDGDCIEECDDEEHNTFGVDCDNCSNTICSHNFCKVYSVPTSFKKGPGYCKYFTKQT